jgi:hypothetical protein
MLLVALCAWLSTTPIRVVFTPRKKMAPQSTWKRLITLISLAGTQRLRLESLISTAFTTTLHLTVNNYLRVFWNLFKLTSPIFILWATQQGVYPHITQPKDLARINAKLFAFWMGLILLVWKLLKTLQSL